MGLEQQVLLLTVAGLSAQCVVVGLPWICGAILKLRHVLFAAMLGIGGEVLLHCSDFSICRLKQDDHKVTMYGY